MEPPTKPNESDCCGSGCNPCIFDVYEEQLKSYETKKKLGISTTARNCISLTSYTTFRLVERKQHTKNTFIYRFCCDNSRNEGTALHYKPGQHFLLRSADATFTRAYTPINHDSYSFSVLIKLYENGAMSRYLKNLPLHSKTLWRGPYGVDSTCKHYKYILGVVQGTGIAPIYAICCARIQDENCETFLQLFCCFRDSGDFLLHDELYALAMNWNFGYQVFFSCDCAPNNIKYNEIVHLRRLCESDVERYLVGKDLRKTQILICGCKEFNEDWLGVVRKCNVLQENIHVFQ